MRHGLNNPESCFLCRRRADGVGVGTPKRQGWVCAECGIPLAKEAIKMSDKAFDAFEQRAIQAAGEAAGAYLDSIGKTDLAQLTAAEWSVFCVTMVRSFGDAIRAEVESGKPPF
jgi:hypothetical protein